MCSQLKKISFFIQSDSKVFIEMNKSFMLSYIYYFLILDILKMLLTKQQRIDIIMMAGSRREIARTVNMEPT